MDLIYLLLHNNAHRLSDLLSEIRRGIHNEIVNISSSILTPSSKLELCFNAKGRRFNQNAIIRDLRGTIIFRDMIKQKGTSLHGHDA